MKLKDLINEVRIFQNNFIKIDTVKDKLKEFFGEENMPEIGFDDKGMFVKIKMELTTREEEIIDSLDFFTLTDGIVVDEMKNIKKFYIEYTKAPEINPEPTDDSEEPPAEA